MRAMIALVLLVLSVSTLSANPTPKQRVACLMDALRYCIRSNLDGTATLDHTGIDGCMRAHKHQLDRACRKFFR